MGHPSRPIPWRQVPLGLLGMLALAMAIESCVGRRQSDFLDTIDLHWTLSRRAAEAIGPAPQVLCFGDSLIKFGLLPRVIQAESGRSACNLAAAAGQPPGSYFLLRRALSAGARPSALVVDFCPHLLALPSPGFNAHRWAYLASAAECLGLAREAGDARFLATALVDQILPTARLRPAIRAQILGLVRGDPVGRARRRSVRIAARNWDANCGAQIMPEMAKPPGPPPSGDKAVFPDTPACDPVNARYMRRFFGLAAAHGIPVYWLMPPVLPETQALWDRSGVDASFTALARSMQAEFPNLIVVDGRRRGYEATVFVDHLHLDRRGASALSHDLASLLRRRSSGEVGPRWVDLPAYGERSPEIAQEDVAQSNLALQSLDRERWLRRRARR